MTLMYNSMNLSELQHIFPIHDWVSFHDDVMRTHPKFICLLVQILQ
jgi:hypothetical protein